MTLKSIKTSNQGLKDPGPRRKTGPTKKRRKASQRNRQGLVA